MLEISTIRILVKDPSLKSPEVLCIVAGVRCLNYSLPYVFSFPTYASRVTACPWLTLQAHWTFSQCIYVPTADCRLWATSVNLKRCHVLPSFPRNLWRKLFFFSRNKKSIITYESWSRMWGILVSWEPCLSQGWSGIVKTFDLSFIACANLLHRKYRCYLFIDVSALTSCVLLLAWVLAPLVGLKLKNKIYESWRGFESRTRTLLPVDTEYLIQRGTCSLISHLILYLFLDNKYALHWRFIRNDLCFCWGRYTSSNLMNIYY